MHDSPSPSTTNATTGRRAGVIRRAVASLVRIALVSAVMLWLVGRFGWGLPEALVSPWAFQQMLGFGLLAAIAAFTRLWPGTALAGAMTLWSGAVVWSAVGITPPAPRPQPESIGSMVAADSPAALRLVLANVRYGNRPSPDALAWIASVRPDVIVLQECSPAWAGAVRSLLGNGLEGVERPRSNPDGVALFSTLPLQAARVRPGDLGTFAGVEALLMHAGRPIRVIGPHTWPPVSKETVEGRNAGLVELADEVRSRRDDGESVVVLGDLNETPWGRAMRELLHSTDLGSARAGQGRNATWPTTLPWLGWPTPSLLMIPIDHCLVSPDLDVVHFEAGPDLGSDHLPIVVELRVPSSHRSP